MTIKECIDIVDDLKPNQYSTKIKVMWLSFVDETIINDVLKTHQGYDGRYDNFTGYTEDKLSVPLIVSSPYDRLYTEYLKMRIDAENGETARYNNSAALFNSYMMEYRKFYNKTHLPLSVSERRAIKPMNKGNSGISEAELENLKRELYAKLSEDFSGMVSNDKLHDIVTNYVNNNLEMIRANDGKDGAAGANGKDGITPHIGENGNWFEGENDTGKPSRGEKGDGADITVDQSYSPASENPQSGIAVEEGMEKNVGDISSALALIIEGSKVIPQSLLNLLGGKLGDEINNKFSAQIEEKIEEKFSDYTNSALADKAFRNTVRKMNAGNLLLEPNCIYGVVLLSNEVQTIEEAAETETPPEAVCNVTVYDETGSPVTVSGKFMGVMTGNYGDTDMSKAEAFIAAYHNLTINRGIYTAKTASLQGKIEWNTSAVVMKIALSRGDSQ